MIKKRDLLVLNHDVNNQLGVAMGNFELMILKNPSLQDSPHAKRLENSLLRARDLSHELAQQYEDSNNNEPANEGLVLIPIQSHFLGTSQPAYDELMARYNIQINLKITTIEEPKKAYINPVELVRLRENLVSNSLAAGATTLDVHLDMKDTYLIATFTDNGKGMSQDQIDKILLFQHGDGKVHGIGSRSIIEGASKHGYYISYTSVLGEGTTIRTLVPYYEEETE